MERNGFNDATNEVVTSAPSPKGAPAKGSLATRELNEIHEEIRHLRLELERLQALQRSPQADDDDLGDEAGDEQSDDSQPGSPADHAARRWRPVHLIIAAALVAGLCVGAYRFWNYLQSYQSTDDAQMNGYLDPISSRINGTVTAVYVNNDQRVQKGQLLVQLDPSDYQVAAEQARAQLAQAEANFNSVRQQYVSAVATIHQAQAQNYLAQRNAQRYAELRKLKVIAPSAYDQYYATARADAATVKVDKAAAASAQRTIASRQAQVKEARAVFDQAKLNLTYTRVTAPANGIIGNRSVELGQQVQPGQSLMALTQMNEL
jgi:membrane fusion protein (multidrug efflux system)